MLEYLLNTKKKGKSFDFSDTGPGPKVVLEGHDDAGFFGEVLTEEFISGDDLANEIGISEGNSVNSSTAWLKFYLDDKILFIPKLPIRNSIAWSSIYNFGCVYGTNDIGVSPVGSGVVQNRTINVQGYYFRVRLLKGTNPELGIEATTGDDVEYSHNSEWNRLFYNLTPSNTSYPQNSQVGDDWFSYTDTILGMQSAALGSKTWCQEQFGNNNTLRVNRSGPNATRLNSDTYNTISNQFGWRPVLELLPDEVNAPINLTGNLFSTELFTEENLFLGPYGITGAYIPNKQLVIE